MAEDPRREANRQEFLEAAAHAIASKGYHGMSMRTLATQMGRSLTSFYTYFSSKEDVLHEIQKRAFDTLLRESATAVASTDSPAGQLYAFILQHVRYVARHHDVMKVLVQEAGALPPSRRRSIRRLKDTYFEHLRNIVRAVQSEGNVTVSDDELERTTYSVFGMLNWTYGWYSARQHGTPSDVARSIHRLALTGLRAGPPSALAIQKVDDAVANQEVPPLLAMSRRVA
jgi:AcrR family transcriptional regulator